ncbi:PadR family transcriptional regulator [Demetria terragena]|uniref:PadR family transcriptional regulator n=1 Tax=Demetria terragena TaxID=63959 RepID=UPI000374182C|nr:helix-turn-helix transcriptional regulator [Demetria terragena]
MSGVSEDDAADEWLEELVGSWVEVYKKSATSLVLLRIIDAIGPAPAAEIGAELARRTGWDLTERGLYRTLRRLASSGLLATVDVPVPRTGAQRKDFTVTDFGHRYLAQIEAVARLA